MLAGVWPAHFRRANTETHLKENVNMSKSARRDVVFLKLGGLLLGISLRLCPWEIPRRSPVSPRKTPSFPPLLLKLTQSWPNERTLAKTFSLSKLGGPWGVIWASYVWITQQGVTHQMFDPILMWCAHKFSGCICALIRSCKLIFYYERRKITIMKNLNILALHKKKVPSEDNYKLSINLSKKSFGWWTLARPFIDLFHPSLLPA